jgi:DNA-3-methyladenine glycosylase I
MGRGCNYPTGRRIEKLLSDEGIVRNKLKIYAIINNAKRFVEIQKENGSFDKYSWQFTKGKTIKNHRKDVKEIPPRTAHSDVMSKSLSETGFKFTGSTICYDFMQAAGMVNDHLVECYRYNSIPVRK